MCARKWSGFTCKRASEDTTFALGLPKKEELDEEEEECQIAIFSSRGAYVNLHLFDWK